MVVSKFLVGAVVVLVGIRYGWSYPTKRATIAANALFADGVCCSRICKDYWWYDTSYRSCSATFLQPKNLLS